MKSAFLYTQKFEDYDYGKDHPFKPFRGRMVYELCYRYGLLNHPWIGVIKPEPASEETMLSFHTREYVDALKKAGDGQFGFTMFKHGLGTSDNPVFEGVFDYSLLVLGATLKGAELIGSGEADVAFNLNGGLHHAKPDSAEGFCYVNDVVVAINYFIEHGYQRTLYIDIDAHHGNGVQDAFYDTNKVLFISLHQDGHTIYPGTGFENEIGLGKGLGYTVNVPLPVYTDDEVYLRTFKEVFAPLSEAYKPEIVVAQIGLGTLKKDPLTSLMCTNNSYRKVIAEIKKSCPRVLALGGGGYSIRDMVRGWTLAWAVLNDLQPEDPYEGLIGGEMYGHERAGDDLYDEPYVLPSFLKEKANEYVDAKLDFIRKNIFPILGAK